MWRALVCIVLAVACGAVTIVCVVKNHVPANLRAVLDGLSANPKVEILEVNGFEKGFGWPIDDDYRVQGIFFRLKGQPDAVIALPGPGSTIFTASDHLFLAGIGPYSLNESSSGTQSPDYRPIDFGPKSDGPLPPFGVTTINDVIDHYDDLIRYLDAQPRVQTYVGRDGLQWTRHLDRVDGRARGRRKSTTASTTKASTRPIGPIPIKETGLREGLPR
jgi:hypothetical protein